MPPSSRGGDRADKRRWSPRKIALALYPLAVGAAAVNIFFFGLLVQHMGFSAFDPFWAIGAGFVLGIPFALVAGHWFRARIDEAEAD
ncbi:MAG TPA: hypothetical protein ENJ68_05840 [Devosia sp.]|nr:hypothetical protein [Devosia sp.]